MRPSPCAVLLAVWLSAPALHAQEPPPATPDSTPAQARIDDLERRLQASEQQRAALGAELQTAAVERETAQLQRLRQENQRLKLQLKQLQAEAPPRLLSDKQIWFAAGAVAVLLGIIVGALLRGGRRGRREWIN